MDVIQIPVNQQCLIRKVIPNYAIFKIPFTSPASQVTQKKIHIIRIKDEIKFLYKKKRKLNRDLYNVHLKAVLYSFLLSVMLDPVFTLLSLERIFCISFDLICFWLSCVEHPMSSDMFHIHPSVDKCWINEVYMCVCMCMCIVVSSRDRQCSVFWDAQILSTFFHPLYF
jgi:hypothetical protein